MNFSYPFSLIKLLFSQCRSFLRNSYLIKSYRRIGTESAMHSKLHFHISKYKYILPGIDAASRYKVARPLRTKQARDVAEMIPVIYKVGPLTYPKIFQCDNGSEFKGDVTKMLEKNEVKIR